MDEKIKIQIYGIKGQILSNGCGCSEKKHGCADGSCGNKKSSCGGCRSNSTSGHSGCGTGEEKTVGEAYSDLEKFIKQSDVATNTELEFIDLNKNNLKEEQYSKVRDIIDKGFESPITVVDSIIRYYGGIPNSYIYKDVKDLLEG